MLKADMGAITKRFSPAIWADPDVLPYAAGVSVWGRWFIWVVSAIEIAYRPGFWYPGDWGFVLLLVPLAALNGLVHFRLLTNRPVTWRWMLALSAMDIALITASITIGPAFDSFAFVAYYPALALSVVVFTSDCCPSRRRSLPSSPRKCGLSGADRGEGSFRKRRCG